MAANLTATEPATPNPHHPAGRSLARNRQRGAHQPPQTPLRLERTVVDGHHRTTVWCGYGVLAHNLVKAARLEAMAA